MSPRSNNVAAVFLGMRMRRPPNGVCMVGTHTHTRGAFVVSISGAVVLFVCVPERRRLFFSLDPLRIVVGNGLLGAPIPRREESSPAFGRRDTHLHIFFVLV